MAHGEFAERSLIEEYFGENAKLVVQKPFPGGLLTIWENAASLPMIRACTFTAPDGNVIIPNRDENVFRNLLAKITAECDNVERICEIIRAASPNLRVVIKRLEPYMHDIESIWHKPSLEGRKFEAYLENMTTGYLEKLVIYGGEGVTIEAAGKGIQVFLR